MCMGIWESFVSVACITLLTVVVGVVVNVTVVGTVWASVALA